MLGRESFFPIVPSKNTDIDPLSVCFYNVNMALNFAGFFRPDHDPPLGGDDTLLLFIFVAPNKLCRPL